MTTKIIELSNSNYNGTSSLLSIIVLISFFYFVVKMHARIYKKMNPKKIYKSPNIFNSIEQNTMLAIKFFLKDTVTTNYKKHIEQYEKQMQDMNSKLKSSTGYMDMVSSVIGELNRAVYNNFLSNIGYFNDFLSRARNVVNQITQMSNTNIEAFKSAYNQFKQRLKNYVNNLMTMLGTIAYQITIISTTPKLGLTYMMEPLNKVYKSIYDTVQNNKKFIKDIDETIDIDNIPKVSTEIKPIIATNFQASGGILRNAGYK